MGSTATSGDFASIRFDWRRPDDKGNSFAPSCITTYDVAIFTVSVCRVVRVVCVCVCGTRHSFCPPLTGHLKAAQACVVCGL
jgi:hypothetical protein